MNLLKRKGSRLTTGEKVFQLFNLIFLLLFAFTTLYPFVYFIACSFNDGADLMRGGVYFFPRVFTLENYMTAFRNKYILSAFSVSVFHTVVGTILSLAVTSLVGYSMTYKEMPGRKWLILSIYLPGWLGAGGIIPTYVLYRNLGLLNSIWVYILPGVFSMGNAILFRANFDAIPSGLIEAARIDGCTEFRIFWKIVLPLSKPILATIALFVGVAHWNAWFAGEYYVTRDNLRPAATLLRQLLTEADTLSAIKQNVENLSNDIVDYENVVRTNTVTADSLRMTFVVILTTPILIVYPFLQKYFVKGIMAGSIKG